MQKSWIWICLLVLLAACRPQGAGVLPEKVPLSEAGEAMRAFTQSRVNEAGELDRQAYLRAFFQHQHVLTGMEAVPLLRNQPQDRNSVLGQHFQLYWMLNSAAPTMGPAGPS